MIENYFFECWDADGSLGIVWVRNTSSDVLNHLDTYWKRWYQNAIHNDEPLDVADFATWIESEFPKEIRASRVFLEQIYAS